MSVMSRLPPASLMWLLLHECRLYWFDIFRRTGFDKQSRTRRWFGRIITLLLIAFFHFLAWEGMRALTRYQHTPSFMPACTAILVMLLTLMLSTAISRSVRALFERGDLDLLLSSPIPTQTVFVMRLIGMGIGIGINFLLFFAPLAHAALILGHWRWIGIYPALLGLGLIAGSFGMLLTLGLVRLLGVRRTKTIGQLLGALMGALLFLLSQVFGQGIRFQLGQRLWTYLQQLPDDQTWLLLPARALFLDPVSLLLAGVMVVLCVASTARLTHRLFALGVQQGTDRVRKPTPVKRLPFRAGLYQTIVRKEWRLIWRDPQLISQVGLSLLYLMPMILPLFHGKSPLAGGAAAITFATGMLTGSLIWIMVSAEDAPDLLRLAPLDPRLIRQAKLLAAILPVCILLAPALIWYELHQPLLGLILGVGCLGAMGSVAIINLWHEQAAKRKQFARRGKQGLLSSMLVLICEGCWAITVYAGFANSWWAAAPLAIALLTVGIAFLTRKTS